MVYLSLPPSLSSPPSTLNDAEASNEMLRYMSAGQTWTEIYWKSSLNRSWRYMCISRKIFALFFLPLQIFLVFSCPALPCSDWLFRLFLHLLLFLLSGSSTYSSNSGADYNCKFDAAADSDTLSDLFKMMHETINGTTRRTEGDCQDICPRILTL